MKQIVQSMIVASFILGLGGCAHTQPEPVRLRLTDLANFPEEEVRAGRPLVIEVHEGETIPLDVRVEGDLVASPEHAPPIPLVAKRTFWLRISKDGLSISRDGVTFGTKSRVPGSFRVGVGATRERGLLGEIVLTTPQP